MSMNYVEILKELKANRRMDANSIAVSASEEFVFDTYLSPIAGDMDMNAVYQLLRTAWGVKLFPRLIIEGNGWVLDPGTEKFRRATKTEWGINAVNPYDAASLLIVSYGLVVNTSNYKESSDLGCYSVPINYSTGEYLDNNNSTVLNISYNKASAIYTNKAEEQAVLANCQAHRANQHMNKIQGELAGLVGAKEGSTVLSKVKELFPELNAQEVIWNLSQCILASYNPDHILFVTDNIYKLLTVVSPCSNIYVIKSHNYLDYAWCGEDAWFVTRLLAAAANFGAKRYITIEELDSEYVVWFEQDYITIRQNGVFDSRERRFMNSLLVSDSAMRKEASEDEVTLLNSFGSYIMSILGTVWYISDIKANQSMGDKEPIARWYRMFTDIVPMDSEAEAGAMDVGQRGDFNQVATQAYTWKELLPFKIDTFGVNTKNTAKSHNNTKGDKGQFTKYTGAKYQLDEAVFKKYNLVRVHKGNMTFMDASYVALQGKHIPTEFAKTLIQKMSKTIGKEVKEVLIPFYFDTDDYDGDVITKALAKGLDDEDKLIELFIAHCGFALSTKISKITKRITLATPSHAEPLEAVRRVFVHYDTITGADWGHRYKAGHFPMVLNTPGICLLLANSLKPFIVKTNYQEQLECVDTNISNWKFSLEGGQAISNDKAFRKVISYDHLTAKVGDNAECKGVAVKQGDLIVSIPYTASGVVHYHDIVAEEDGFIQSITYWSTKIGKQDVLVVRINYFDIQYNAKIRNTFKALVGRPSTVLTNGEQVVHNTLNNKLDALLGKSIPKEIDIIVTGDSDKSKDLLAGLLDIAAETAQGNNNYEAIRKLNILLGKGDADYHYHYHELLAIAGEYDSFLADFIHTYGRPVWFLTQDTPNAMLRAVRELYINKSEVSNKAKWVRHTYNELITACPEVKGYDFGISNDKLIIVTSNVHKDGSICAYDEVFVFGSTGSNVSTDLSDFMWQRSFGFIGDGNRNTNVYINAKVELCSVDQSVTSSPLMSAVARCIDLGLAGVKPQHRDAVRLMAKVSKEAATQYIAIQSMAKGLPLMNKKGKAISTIDLFNKEGVINPELVTALELDTLVDDAKNNTLDLIKLARKAKQISIGVGNDKYIYLAAILNQSRRTDMYESLSGLTYVLLRNAILGSKKAELDNRIERILGSIQNLAKSSNLEKAIFMGRKSAQNKTLGCFGLPIDWYTTWIDSPAFWEIVDSAVSANLIKNRNEWVKLIGCKVLVTRPPLPFPAVLLFMPTLSLAQYAKAKAEYDLTKIESIKQFMLAEYGVELNDNQANILRYCFKRNYGALINKSQAGINPIVCYVSGGDHDGDGYTCTVLDFDSKLPLLTYKTVMQVIFDRTGINAVDKAMGAYIADHYMPKCWKPKQIEAPTLMQLGNLTVIDRVPSNEGLIKDTFNYDSAGVSDFKHSLINDLKASTKMQGGLVGITHKLAVTTEIRIGIANKCKQELIDFDPNFENYFEGSVLSSLILLALYELYEAGTLGGLSWEGYNACNLLASVMRTEGLKLVLPSNGKDALIVNDKGQYQYGDSLRKASINVNHAHLYHDAAEAIRRIESFANDDFIVETSTDNAHYVFTSVNGKSTICTHNAINGATLVDFASYMLFRLCGGRFTPKAKVDKNKVTINGHAALALAVYYCPSKLWKQMKKHSVSIYNLDIYLNNVLPIVCPNLVTLGLTGHQSVVNSTNQSVPYGIIDTGKFLN